MSHIQTAIIGLGAMGMGMAKNIIKAGIPLKGYDISPDAMVRFSELGGTPSTRDTVTQSVQLIIIMVVNIDQARRILLDEGLAAAADEGTTIMLCSTVSPSEVRALEADLKQYGLNLLDAPVSGGQVGADEGTLTIMASGSSASFACAKKVLQAISKKTYKLGDTPGQAATYKVVHQLAAGVHLVAAAELMAFGVKAGCDADTLFDIVAESAGQSWMFKDRVPRILDNDYAPRSMIDIFVKDLDLVMNVGKDCGASLLLASTAAQVLADASSQGYGKMDDAAVVKVYEMLNNKRVRE